MKGVDISVHPAYAIVAEYLAGVTSMVASVDFSRVCSVSLGHVLPLCFSSLSRLRPHGFNC